MAEEITDLRLQRDWTVMCDDCGAKPGIECCSVVSGCVLTYGHLSRHVKQNRLAKDRQPDGPP